MATPSNDDLERLANRLAMLASGDGEAGNAGRAVSQMARRLGLSGGDLKEMFLAGSRGGPAPRRPEPAADHAEVNELRRQVRDLEAMLRTAQQEREMVQAELTGLKLQSYRKTARRGPALAIGAMVALVGVGVGALVLSYGPDLSRPAGGGRDARSAASPSSGVVRGRSAIVYREPDRVAPPVSALQGGAQVVVRRLLWNSFSQWAEVEIPGGSGFVLVTDLELR